MFALARPDFFTPIALARRLHQPRSMLRLPAMEHAVLVTVSDQPGTLFQLTRVLAEHNANISYVDIIHPPTQEVQVYFEFRLEGSAENVLADLGKISNVRHVESTPPFSHIYGKRI